MEWMRPLSPEAPGADPAATSASGHSVHPLTFIEHLLYTTLSSCLLGTQQSMNQVPPLRELTLSRCAAPQQSTRLASPHLGKGAV